MSKLFEEKTTETLATQAKSNLIMNRKKNVELDTEIRFACYVVVLVICWIFVAVYG